MKPYDDAYHQHLLQCKEAMRKGNFDFSQSDLDSTLSESWERCVKYGINPEQTVLNVVMHPELQSALGRLRPLLFEMIRIRMGKMNEQGYFPDMAVFCVSMDGYITYITGEPRLLEQLEKENWKTGTDINEHRVGTNAAALCIHMSDVVEIQKQEHFLEVFCKYTSVAVPYYDHNNKQVAVLGMITDKMQDSRFPKILLRLMASNLRRIGQLHFRHIAIADYDAYLDRLIRDMDHGVILLNSRRQIIKINAEARNIFLGSTFELLGQQIQKLIPASYLDFSALESSVEDVPVVISSLHYQASVQYIAPHQWMEKKYIVTLKRPPTSQPKPAAPAVNTAQYRFSDIIGQSAEIRQSIHYARIAAASSGNVLITGESGTGKELFAQSIHNENSYYDGPFVAINCGAIPKHLIESELFGYVAGAFTGARKGGAPGKIESADGGTLFLDEIGDMPLELQVTLLRFLQNREFTRVGGTKTIHVDVRVIAATNKNLEEEIEHGNFRADLYYRLNLLNIHIPALRDRRQDILPLAEYFLHKHQLVPTVSGFTSRASQVLYHYDWPGNVRELENAVARAALMARGSLVDVDCLPERLVAAAPMPMQRAASAYMPAQVKSIQEMERDTIQQVLFATGGNVKLAAEQLGMSQRTLYRRIKEHHIFYKK